MPDKSIKQENIASNPIQRGAGFQVGNEAPSQNGTAATTQQRIKPPKDTNWTNKGVQWRPEHYRALKLLAAALGKEFRVVHETAIAEYIERHKGEIPNG